jgi:hypothetical protein
MEANPAVKNLAEGACSKFGDHIARSNRTETRLTVKRQGSNVLDTPDSVHEPCGQLDRKAADGKEAHKTGQKNTDNVCVQKGPKGPTKGPKAKRVRKSRLCLIPSALLLCRITFRKNKPQT